jgi:hypothetical protein
MREDNCDGNALGFVARASLLFGLLAQGADLSCQPRSVEHLLLDQHDIVRLISGRILVEGEYCATVNLSTDKDKVLRITKR